MPESSMVFPPRARILLGAPAPRPNPLSPPPLASREADLSASRAAGGRYFSLPGG